MLIAASTRARYDERRDGQLREPFRDQPLDLRFPLVRGGGQELGGVLRRQVRGEEDQPAQVHLAVGQGREDPGTPSPRAGDLDPFGGGVLGEAKLAHAVGRYRIVGFRHVRLPEVDLGDVCEHVRADATFLCSEVLELAVQDRIRQVTKRVVLHG